MTVNAGMIAGGVGGGGGDEGSFQSDYRGGAGAAGGAGVRLIAGGDILNTGTVQGGQGGAGHYNYDHGGHGGAGGAGIVLAGGGTVVNRGLIAGGAGGQGGANHRHRYSASGAGGAGIYAGPGGAVTVTNAGTIVGSVDSVVFASSGDTLIAEAGAQFGGAIVGGGGTFTLAGGTGVIAGLGGAGQLTGDDSATFSGFRSYEIGGGGGWTLSGTNALAAGQGLTVNGALAVQGSLTEEAFAVITISQGAVLRFQSTNSLDGTIVNNGLLSIEGAALTVTGALVGFGVARLDGGSLTVLETYSESVTFAGGPSRLGLAQSLSYFGTISGFSDNGQDVLDLGDIKFKDAGEATFSGTASGGILTVSNGTNAAHIRLAGNFLGDTFVAASDGQGGVTVVALDGAPSIHAFVAAMAGMGGDSHGPVSVFREAHYAHPPMLTVPRMALA